MDQLSLPYIDLSDMPSLAWVNVSDAQRWHLVEMLLHQNGLAREELVPPWSSTPMLAWIRLVMHVNDIELDIGTREHIEFNDTLGARLSTVDLPLSIFIWAIA